MPLGQNLFFNRPVVKPDTVTVKDILTLKHFNAQYQVDPDTSDYYNCGDPTKAELLRKNVLDSVIRCGNSRAIDFNFFRDLYQQNERMVDTKEVWNMYDVEDDYNIMFQSAETASGAGLSFTATLLRDNHNSGGKRSFPARGFLLQDKDSMIMYSIEAKDDAIDYNHKLTLKPLSGTLVGSVKPYRKYLVVPARMVRGTSCPLITNEMPTTPWMQKVKPVRFRRDWEVEIDLLRGYQDQLQWTILYDKDGTKVNAWDSYQMIKAREGLQLALNMWAFTGNPVTNPDFIDGVTTLVIDDVHTGFYGYMPTLKYGGGNVLDYDMTQGLSVEGDLLPFLMSQEALKRTNSYTVLHGFNFMATLTKNVNTMIKLQGGANEGALFNRTNGNVSYNPVTSFEWLGKRLDFKLFEAIADERLMGSAYFNNIAIMTPNDGVVDTNGRAVRAVEFYQYGMNGETGGYWEETVDKRTTNLCEYMAGSVAQSEMMAFHCPGQHMLIQPIQRC